jgi:hypothetical protein
MQAYEYKVIPAPGRGIRVRGARSGAERFAAAVADRMNAMARDGWEYVRSDLLPCEERTGLTLKSQTVYHNLLVFRRPVASAAVGAQPDATFADASPAPAAPMLTFPRIRLGMSDRAESDAPRLVADAPEGRAPQVGPADASGSYRDDSAETARGDRSSG